MERCWSRGKAGAATRRVRVVAVGDGGCGKTTLLLRLAHLPHLPPDPPDHPATPPPCEVSQCRLNHDGAQVELELVDTRDGNEALPARAAAYVTADVILLCFSIDNAGSLDHVTSAWLPEVREHCRKQTPPPLLLVGTKADVRHAPGLQTSVTFIKQGPVKAGDARAVAARAGVALFLECSARGRGQGLASLLQGALAAAAANHRPPPRRPARLLRKLLRAWAS